MSELGFMSQPTMDSSNIHRPDSQKMPEFGDPSYPVLVRPCDGVRISLGSHDFFDLHKPDIQLASSQWLAIFLTLGGSDRSGYAISSTTAAASWCGKFAGGLLP